MDDTLDDCFESPKLLVEEAVPSTHELDAICQQYVDNHPMQFIDYVDGRRGLRVVGYRRPKERPRRARVLASRIIKDLRDALDQATFQASKAIIPKAGNWTYFPFSQSPDDFDTLFDPKRGRSRDIPRPLWPFLKAFEPWPTSQQHEGGNDLLRVLGYVSGPNKHQVTLGVATNAGFTNIHHLSGGALTFAWHKGDFEVVRAHPSAPLIYNFGCFFFVSFNEPRQLAGGPAPAILRDLASIVERIVLGIEAETARILRERGQ